jgi:hypothetical protein
VGVCALATPAPMTRMIRLNKLYERRRLIAVTL